jgi:hypothetical protein
MLTAIPHHWFSWNFTLFDQGRSLAEIGLSSWREKGGLTIGNSGYRVYREGLFTGAFVLESGGTAVARAEKPSAMTRRMIIDFRGTQFELRPRGIFSRGFQLLSRGAVVGTLSAGGFFSRRMDVELSEELPLPLRAFVVWLTLLLWKRDMEAAA